MPHDCREFVDNIQGFLETTSKLLMGVPLHKFIKTQNWKNLVKHFEKAYSIASGLTKSRIEEIEREAETGEGEEKDDFLSHMIHSGKMSVEEVAVNAIDLMSAGIDTVRIMLLNTCQPYKSMHYLTSLFPRNKENFLEGCV